MKVFQLLIMLTGQLLLLLLLLLSLFAPVYSLPITQPPTLLERNQAIGWEAWLLIKEPNDRHRGTDDKEIIRQPKSVFTVDNFPVCSEGHKPDSNGQCIKFVKLDEQNQLSFVESKLMEIYGKLDYESPPNESAPTRFELSLNLSDADDYINDTPEEETDMAIIITPVIRDNNEDMRFDNSNIGKRDDNTKEDMYEKELKKLLEPATTAKTFDDTTLEIKSDTESQTVTTVVAEENDDDNEPTTSFINDSTTDVVATTQFDDSNVQADISVSETTTRITLEGTTTDTTTAAVDTTTTTTTADDFDELTTFSKTVAVVTTPTPKITTYHPMATTYHPFFDLSRRSNSGTKNLVKFPDEAPIIARSHSDGNYVRFPDVDTKYQQESLGHHTRNVDDQTGNFFNEIVTPQPSQWTQQLVLPPTGFYPKFFPSKDDSVAFENVHAPRRYEYQTATTEQHPTKKFREKPNGRFQFPPKWSSEKHPKPIVLRSVPMDDLAYFFGYKNGHTSHR